MPRYNKEQLQERIKEVRKEIIRLGKIDHTLLDNNPNIHNYGDGTYEYEQLGTPPTRQGYCVPKRAEELVKEEKELERKLERLQNQRCCIC
jgi:hypothetical protein